MFCDWSDNFFKEREEISGLSNMEERIRRARGTTTGRVTRNLRVISCVLQLSFTLFIHYIRRKITFFSEMFHHCRSISAALSRDSLLRHPAREQHYKWE